MSSKHELATATQKRNFNRNKIALASLNLLHVSDIERKLVRNLSFVIYVDCLLTWKTIYSVNRLVVVTKFRFGGLSAWSEITKKTRKVFINPVEIQFENSIGHYGAAIKHKHSEKKASLHCNLQSRLTVSKMVPYIKWKASKTSASGGKIYKLGLCIAYLTASIC